MSTDAPSNRRIKFLARNLPFPTDPTFREFRVVEELTGVTAQDIMTGNAGVWMLPCLAIVAMMRSQPDISQPALAKLLDLTPNDFELEGDFNVDDDEDPTPAVEEKTATGTESTDETPEPSGTPDSPTTSQEQQENLTT